MCGPVPAWRRSGEAGGKQLEGLAGFGEKTLASDGGRGAEKEERS